MQPAVPGRRHGRGLGDAVVDHPPPLEFQRWIDLATFGPVVAIAELVLADELAIEPGPQLGAEGLAVPPGEEAQEKRFHRGVVCVRAGAARSCHRDGMKSRSSGGLCCAGSAAHILIKTRTE